MGRLSERPCAQTLPRRVADQRVLSRARLRMQFDRPGHRAKARALPALSPAGIPRPQSAATSGQETDGRQENSFAVAKEPWAPPLAEVTPSGNLGRNVIRGKIRCQMDFLECRSKVRSS